MRSAAEIRAKIEKLTFEHQTLDENYNASYEVYMQKRKSGGIALPLLREVDYYSCLRDRVQAQLECLKWVLNESSNQNQ